MIWPSRFMRPVSQRLSLGSWSFARDNPLLYTWDLRALRILVDDHRLCGGVARHCSENLETTPEKLVT